MAQKDRRGRRYGDVVHLVIDAEHHVDAGRQHAVDARERVRQFLRQGVGHAGLDLGGGRDHAVTGKHFPQVLEGFARQAVLLEDLQGAHQLVVIHQQGIAVLAGGLFFRLDPPSQQGGKHLVGLILGQARVHLHLAAGKEQKQGKQQKKHGTQHEKTSDKIRVPNRTGAAGPPGLASSAAMSGHPLWPAR